MIFLDENVAHNILAFFVKCCLDEERTKSKAQGVISVFNTSLPAWGARLQQTKNRDNHSKLISYCGTRRIKNNSVLSNLASLDAVEAKNL